MNDLNCDEILNYFLSFKLFPQLKRCFAGNCPTHYCLKSFLPMGLCAKNATILECGIYCTLLCLQKIISCL